MSGPIVRTGTTPEYWANWDQVFGDKSKKSTKKTAAKSSGTTAKKTAKKATKKKAPKAKKK